MKSHFEPLMQRPGNLFFPSLHDITGAEDMEEKESAQGFHKDLHASPQAQQVESGLLLGVVIRSSAAGQVGSCALTLSRVSLASTDKDHHSSNQI